ncbi:MAG: cytochrome c [Maritimibacter sp.]
MINLRTLALGIAGSALIASSALAHDDVAAPAIKARHSLMSLYAYNLGSLGAMAQGKMPYDAEMAQAAADNLALLSKLNAASMWPAGSDADHAEGSNALPALWENFPDVGAKAKALSDATDAMAAAAGTDLASLQAAMGPLGGACAACHKAYRAPN